MRHFRHEQWNVATIVIVVACLALGACVTGEVADSFTPTWNQYAEASIPAGSSLIFWVWDSDVSDDDFMFSCALDPLTADFLDARGAFCDNGQNSLLIGFDP